MELTSKNRKNLDIWENCFKDKEHARCQPTLFLHKFTPVIIHSNACESVRGKCSRAAKRRDARNTLCLNGLWESCKGGNNLAEAGGNDDILLKSDDGIVETERVSGLIERTQWLSESATSQSMTAKALSKSLNRLRARVVRER